MDRVFFFFFFVKILFIVLRKNGIFDKKLDFNKILGFCCNSKVNDFICINNLHLHFLTLY